MIIPKTNENRFKDTYSAEAVQFRISEKNQRHIIHMLRDQIYEDKMMAPIREYCCNAFDANIEAGKGQVPIQVTIPTTTDPSWSVRDFGKGLTPLDISEIFTQYGESTKRQSNNVTGCLGIGSKSFFAYTDQFTIESWVNGQKYTFICALNEDSDAIVKCIHKKESNMSSGVRITAPIATRDIPEFRNKTYTYLDTLLLTNSKFTITNDKKDELLLEKRYSETYQDDCQWWIMEEQKDSPRDLDYHHNMGEARIIMGHVCYEIDPNQLPDISGSTNQVARTPSLYIQVPLGCVSITASREGLEYNKQTIAYLTSILPKVSDSIKKVMAHHITTAKNYWEACRHYNSAMDTLPYNLKKIQSDLHHTKSKQKVSGNISLYLLQADGSKSAIDAYTYEMRTLRTGKIQLKRSDRQYIKPTLNTSVFIDDRSEAKSKVGRRIRAWMNDNMAYNLVLIRNSRSALKSSTIQDFVDDLPDIQTIEPVAVNYTQSGVKGVSTPSKAVAGLFIADLEKIESSSKLNRDAFESTDDDSATIDGVEQLAIEINGFRYAGKDYGRSGLPTDTIWRVSNLLKDRYNLPHTVVAYRPKHAHNFTHLRRFWDIAIESIKEELKTSNSLAYDILFHRESWKHEVYNADDDTHDVWSLLKQLKKSSNPAVRKLALLSKEWRDLQDAKHSRLSNLMILLDIDPNKYTKRKLPNAKELTLKALEAKPVLKYIKEPYYYRYYHDTDDDEKKGRKLFIDTLRKTVK